MGAGGSGAGNGGGSGAGGSGSGTGTFLRGALSFAPGGLPFLFGSAVGCAAGSTVGGDAEGGSCGAVSGVSATMSIFYLSTKKLIDEEHKGDVWNNAQDVVGSVSQLEVQLLSGHVWNVEPAVSLHADVQNRRKGLCVDAAHERVVGSPRPEDVQGGELGRAEIHDVYAQHRDVAEVVGVGGVGVWGGT